MIKLRDYQKDLHDRTIKALETNDRVLVVAPTGAGKSVLIAYLADQLEGRSLILTHRKELLEQNSSWIKGVGTLQAHKRVNPRARIIVGMVETVHARFKKYGTKYLGHFDNVIIDEVHFQAFEKVFKKIPHRKTIGFTATPVINKKRTFKIDGIEHTQQITLSEQFDVMVQGIGTQGLVDRGFLSPERLIELTVPDIDRLVDSESTPDGFTADSLSEVFGNTAAISVLDEAIEKYCRNKKVLIFNVNTKVNEVVTEHLEASGFNVRSYDSVNNKPKERQGIVEWFRNQREAILVNANVFTTGFDVSDVEVVIINRATKSIGLYLQMVGRGSRITDVIYKDHFTVLDLGANTIRHGRWSDEIDWEKYFYPSPPKIKRKVEIVEVWECKACGAFNKRGTAICEVCGEERETKRAISEGTEDVVFVEREAIPYPSGRKIVDYVSRQNGSETEAFNLLDDRILELFRYTKVTKERFLSQEEDFLKRVIEIYRPIYFAIIHSDLPTRKRRRYSTQLVNITNKIYKHFLLPIEKSEVVARLSEIDKHVKKRTYLQQLHNN